MLDDPVTPVRLLAATHSLQWEPDRAQLVLQEIEQEGNPYAVDAKWTLCQVCGLVIGDPDDYFALGPISDDPGEPLSRFDWFQAHLHCLRDWDGTPGLVRALEDTSHSAEWEGDVLERSLTRIKTTEGDDHLDKRVCRKIATVCGSALRCAKNAVTAPTFARYSRSNSAAVTAHRSPRDASGR